MRNNPANGRPIMPFGGAGAGLPAGCMPRSARIAPRMAFMASDAPMPQQTIMEMRKNVQPMAMPMMMSNRVDMPADRKIKPIKEEKVDEKKK